MSGRRVRMLTTVTRHADQRLRESAMGLAALRGRIAELQAERNTVIQRLHDEGRTGSLETAPYVGDFIRAMRAQQLRLDARIALLETEAEAATDALRLCYSDATAYGTVLDQVRTALARHRDRQEQGETTELGLARWRIR